TGRPSHPYHRPSCPPPSASPRSSAAAQSLIRKDRWPLVSQPGPVAWPISPVRTLAPRTLAAQQRSSPLFPPPYQIRAAVQPYCSSSPERQDSTAQRRVAPLESNLDSHPH